MRLAAVLLVCATSMGCNAAHVADDANDGPDGGACGHASDCPSSTVCIGGHCVASSACISSRTCPGLVCDTTHGVCADCNTAPDCAAAGATCEAHVCTHASRCASDTDCGATLHCDPARGLCVPCNRSADCDAEDFCNGTHDCVPDVCVGGSATCVGAGVATCHDDGSGLNAPMHCASGACADGVCVVPFDAGIDATVARDAGTDAMTTPDAGHDAANDTGPLACRGGTLGGVGIPVGTIVTTSGGTSGALAIDGDLTTAWNGGDYTASIHLVFPFGIPVQGIAISAGSNPATPETYTVTSGSGTVLGSGTFAVGLVGSGDPGPRVGAISFPFAGYTDLTITIDGHSSWVAIFELSLVTSDCP